DDPPSEYQTPPQDGIPDESNQQPTVSPDAIPRRRGVKRLSDTEDDTDPKQQPLQ
ncbi:unnamed protein product, partial [Aphanomyces euteiches]